MSVILAINPGSTSTKLALFNDLEEMVSEEFAWNLPAGLRGEAAARETARYGEAIEAFLKSHRLVPDAVVGRGGFIRRDHCRLRAGVYEVVKMVNGRATLCEDIHRGVTEDPELDHASNFGIPVAARIALDLNIPAFCVDPVVADDMQAVARISGYAGIERRALAHVLSVRAMCRKAAGELGLDFATARMVALHLGGGITVAAVRDGMIVDCNNALLGGGPFSPQRAGALPLADVIDLCFSGRFTQAQLHRELAKNAGLVSYLGDDDMIRIEQRISGGDEHAAAVVEAMVYQIAKETGAMAVAAGLPVDAIVISGGLARAERVITALRHRVAHLAPVIAYPGSLEMEAMAHGTWRVLTGAEAPLSYQLPGKQNPIP